MGDFDNFVRAQSLTLLRVAYLLTGSKTDAEDLTQEALLQVHRAWGRVARAKSPGAYARRTLVNLYLSKRRRPRLATVTLMEDGPNLAEREIPDLLAEQDCVRAALVLLPDRQRTALVLRYYMELSDAEIAEAMDINASSARSAIARGLAALRAQLIRQEIGK